MNQQLEIEKEKAKFILSCDARFNPNHNADGKFGFGSGGSSGSGSGSGSDEEYISATTEIKYKFKNREKWSEAISMIEDLASEYNSPLQEVREGSAKSAGSTQISGTVVSLSNQKPEVVMHEFAHTLAMENRDKFGLSDNSDFFKEVKKIQRKYKKDVGDDTKQYISSYEHSSKGSDEFLAEAFALAKMIQKGIDPPSHYGTGKAIDYSNQVLSIVDKYFSKTNDGNRSEIMNKDLEQRSYSFEIRAEQNEDEVGIITGRPIVYDSRTDLGFFDEIIERGALNGANLRDVRFLVNHDISKVPLARSRNNNANSTMQLMPDDQGMAIRVNLDIKNNSDARNLYSAIERGDISGMSFMFRVDDEEWSDIETAHPVRHVRKISDVVEVSAVTFPAYEDTSISVRNKEALENAKLALESAKRSSKEALESALELEKVKFEALLKVR